MDVNPVSVESPPPADHPPPGPTRTAGRLLGDARAVASVLLLLSVAAEPVTPGLPQLRRLLELLSPCPDPLDETASVLRQIYGAVNDLRRLGE